jgi:hypothetical protein
MTPALISIGRRVARLPAIMNVAGSMIEYIARLSPFSAIVPLS